MPAGFELCVKKGGRVRTLKLSRGRYRHICYLNGKSYRGEIKTKKRHASPDTGASIFILKNKMPSEYQDRRVVTLDDNEEKLKDLVEELKKASK